MPDDQPAVPDVDRLARSMLLLHGDHHDHNDSPSNTAHVDPGRSQGISLTTRSVLPRCAKPAAPSATVI